MHLIVTSSSGMRSCHRQFKPPNMCTTLVACVALLCSLDRPGSTVAMSQLRGDNDLFSLMDQMSAAQGYADEPVALSGRASDNFEEIPVARRVRLTPEVPGYPSDKAAGSTMIWNPYTKVSAPDNPECIFPPTNPQVEVFRRRAYERFKSEFKASLDRISVQCYCKSGT